MRQRRRQASIFDESMRAIAPQNSRPSRRPALSLPHHPFRYRSTDTPTPAFVGALTAANTSCTAEALAASAAPVGTDTKHLRRHRSRQAPRLQSLLCSSPGRASSTARRISRPPGNANTRCSEPSTPSSAVDPPSPSKTNCSHKRVPSATSTSGANSTGCATSSATGSR